ncbi:MAG: hypothetical protein M1358_14225, partial [Chloroflexi bacterium]|nr:hypothetical protein [Chloroflexota bacterium]
RRLRPVPEQAIQATTEYGQASYKGASHSHNFLLTAHLVNLPFLRGLRAILAGPLAEVNAADVIGSARNRELICLLPSGNTPVDKLED